MTTLADMTTEQRKQCVGMWGKNLNYTGKGDDYGVIACVQHDCVWLIHTKINGQWSCFSTNSVIPQPEMPRAWQADGTPPAGAWEFDCLPATDPANPTNKDILDKRWVSAWEEA